MAQTAAVKQSKANARAQKQLGHNTWRKAFMQHYWLYIMMLPALLYMIIFNYLPMTGLYMAFTDFSPFNGDTILESVFGSPFVGLKYFKKLFTGPDFWTLFRNTLSISLANLFFAFPAPIILALILNELRCKWFKRTAQTLVYIPHFVSIVIVAALTFQMFSTTDGAIYHVLTQIFGANAPDLLSDPKLFPALIVGQTIWKETGYGTIIYLAALSSGESWWDEQYARKLRHALAEEEAMARLSFVRQVDGYLQVAYELHGAGSADEQAAQLCGITSRCLGKPMTIAERERAHVRLTEMPLMMVEAGAASRCIAGADICGDTFSLGQLQDGRFVAALSDGMGHGNQAALESRQAVELLRMCLDAGYDRAQTLTAVNGMMLLAGQGERFTTVDLFLLDLWTGKASLDKLGAAGSYLMQAEGLSLLGGDALPLGILENVESGEKLMQLHQGDTLILLSDGVEDAYENRQSMEEAIRDALTLETAQDAANAILTGAQSGDAAPADDQTVLVLRLIRARADAKIEEMYQ